MNKAVLIISPFFSPNTGGVETHLDDLCAVLREKEVRTYVIAYQPLTTKAKGKRLERSGSVTTMRINWYGYNLFHKLVNYPIFEFLYLFPGIFLKSLHFMFRNKQEIGVIHSQGLIASCVAKILKRLFNKRIIASTHAIYNFNSRFFLAKVARYIFSSFDKILTLSEQSKKELAQAGIDTPKILVYRYWLDQEIFKPLEQEECKVRLGWNCKFIVLFVGRLIAIKGVRLLLKLTDLLREDICIAIVGDGPLASEVTDKAKDNKRIIFAGRVPNKDLPVYYSAADLVLMPSLYEEAYGRVILEGLSCAKPVVASTRGGIGEALSEEVGILIEPTLENIADAINEIYQSPEARLKLSSGARQYALNRFSKNNAETIIESYNLK